MDLYSLIMESWRAKLVEYERHPEQFTFGSAPPFKALNELRKLGNHSLQAALHEGIGMADLLLVQTRADTLPLIVLESMGHLVTAAHLFRVDGDGERSMLTGERALHELKAILRRVNAGSFDLQAPHVRWYLVEMAGDAAVCCNRLEAARLYREATEGFRNVDSTEQMSDLQDPFPGDYLHGITHPDLLHGFPAHIVDKGTLRIAYKLKHWIEP